MATGKQQLEGAMPHASTKRFFQRLSSGFRPKVRDCSDGTSLTSSRQSPYCSKTFPSPDEAGRALT